MNPELHIAQQSRRDKLRIQQDTYFPNHALTYDASEMINFTVNPLLNTAPLKRPEEAPFPTADAQYFSTWKTIGGSQDWVPNHTSIYSSTNPISALNVKPNYLGYDQELHPSLANSDMNGASSLYQNIALQDLELASLRHKTASGETGHGSPWVVGGNGSSQWCGARSNAQALSLSLSSVPPPKVHETQIAERGLQARGVCGVSSDQDSRTWKPEMLLPPINQNVSNTRALGAQGLTHRNPGPLGPFTGYATILRSSRFLRPAQQMLEELCCVAGPKDVELCDVSDEILEEARVSSEGAANNNDHSMGAFVFDGSSGKSQEAGGTSCSLDAHRPENHQRKAKLLFMKDEVGKCL